MTVPAQRTARRRAARGAVGVTIVLAAACTTSPSEYEKRGDRYSSRGEYVDARVEYQLALDQAGEGASTDLGMKAAVLALRSKDFGDAERMFDRLLAEEEGYADRVASLYYLHAQRWAAAGDTFAALRAVDWLQERDSTASLGTLYFMLGDAAYGRPDYEQAVSAYLMALARVPDEATAVVYHRLGEAHERRRNCAAAIGYFQRYLAAQGEEASLEAGDVRYRMGSCAFLLAERAFASGDLPRAQQYLDLMVRAGEPVNRLADADFMQARIHERLGDREKALQYYRRVVEQSRDRSSRTSMEAYRRLKQLEFGLPLNTAERLAEEAARDSMRQTRRTQRDEGRP